jgi:thioredoxin-like negative regulator of GroEL
LDNIAANGKDLEARFSYAKWLFEIAQRNEEAIEECMTIMT